MSSRDHGFIRFAASAAWLSGVTGALGVAFLIAMFVAFAVGQEPAGMTLGAVNDTLVIVAYVLAAPTVIALDLVISGEGRIRTSLLTMVGLGAIAAIAVLQGLLVAGALAFEAEVGPVSVALLVFGAWLVVAGRRGAADGRLPGGTRMGLVGATYFGYPLWAFWVSRHLRALAGGSALVSPMEGPQG
jgi:hypothetical protein